MKKTLLLLLVIVFISGCSSHETDQDDSPEEQLRVAYAFLLKKLSNDLHGNQEKIVASRDNRDINIISDVIRDNKNDLSVETFENIDRSATDLCYYTRSSKKFVALVGASKKLKNTYYISYYLGPEGGALKTVELGKKNNRWVVLNADDRWIVK